MKRIYLSGPMTGLPGLNFPAFAAMTNNLRADGHTATNPADKKTLNKFRRFTGRFDGLSISFEQHLLGSKIEFDEAGGTLTLRSLPTQLTDQLKRASA